MESILTTVKKMVGGLSEDDESFDLDLILYINSVLSVLHQMGIGPENGFSIEDNSATWADFIPDAPKWSLVKTYVVSKVRLAFDPPQSATALESLKNIISESEWRLGTTREENQNG